MSIVNRNSSNRKSICIINTLKKVFLVILLNLAVSFDVID